MASPPWTKMPARVRSRNFGSTSVSPNEAKSLTAQVACYPAPFRLTWPIASTSTFASTASDVVGFCRRRSCRPGVLPPFPARDLRHVIAVPENVFAVLDELVADCLLRVCGSDPEVGDAIDHVADQVEAVEVVAHTHVEGGRGGAFLLVAVHVDVVVPRSPVGKAVNE